MGKQSAHNPKRKQLSPEERLAVIDAEIDRRFALRRRIESKGLQQLALEMYAQDVVAWVNDWCWTYDPRNPDLGLPAYLPMNLFPRQEEWMRWVHERRKRGENGWTWKSRGTGVSYCGGVYGTWAWRFEDGFSGSYLSMKEEEVDSKDDPDSLFQKIRITLDWLPQWMLPEGFVLRGEFDNHRRIINPENGNTLSGDIGKNAGRGGRKTWVFIDEAAHLANLKGARTSLYNTANCIIEVSTPNGTGEPFYQAVQEGGEQVFEFPWHAVPWYTDEWYAMMKEKYRRAGDMAGFAQEVDMDFSASVKGLAIPATWVRAATLWRPSEEYEPDVVRYGLDVADSENGNETVLTRRRGVIVDHVHTRSQKGTTKTARWARHIIEADGNPLTIYDADGIGGGVGDAWAEDESPPSFTRTAFHGGIAPTDHYWPNGKTSKERFVNLKAEVWWMVRERFRKTHERWLHDAEQEGGEFHPDEECISLQVDPEMDNGKTALQLSQPKYELKSKNKIAIESKKDLTARGIQSPDYADALVMSFMPVVEWTWRM